MYRLDSLISSCLVERLLAAVTQVDIAPGPGGSRFSPWAETKEVYEPLLAEDFPSLSQVAVVALYPFAQIPAHCDAAISGIRYHLPLQVNPESWSFSGGVWQKLEVGKVYSVDPTEVHGAVNWGEKIRLHLLVDVG